MLKTQLPDVPSKPLSAATAETVRGQHSSPATATVAPAERPELPPAAAAPSPQRKRIPETFPDSPVLKSPTLGGTQSRRSISPEPEPEPASPMEEEKEEEEEEEEEK